MIRLILICLAFLLSCQKSGEMTSEQSIRINIGDDPQSLDPRKARDQESTTLVHMFFEGLTRTSKSGDLEMALADSVEISDDGLQYRFSLRKSFWSNGDPVTSFDFAESWRAILDPQFPTDIAYQLYGIKNAQKAKLGEVSLSQVGITAPDAQSLIVDLEYPIPYFLELLTMTSFFPVHHKHASENRDWAFDPKAYVCNGPFKLGKWDHSDQIEAVKNEKYWQADDVILSKVNLYMMGDDTELQMFQEGNLDWSGSPLSTIPVDAVKELRSNHELCINPFSATFFFRVNTSETLQGKKNPLNSSSFRRALALAVNRRAITDHILQGGQIPAKGLVPPEMGLSDKGYFSDDQAQARSLMMDALLKLDLTLERLEPLKISFASSERTASIVQAVQKQWEDVLGIKVELEAVESKTYFQRISHKEFQIAAGSWTADFNDPINFLEVFKYKEASTNNTNWESSRYIDLLNQSALCKDLKERRGLLREAEELLMEQMPIIPVFHYALNYLKRNGLEEVALSPLGQIDFRWAHFEGVVE